MSSILRVVLTGGIATGKSYVRARFEALGVPTIDADLLAREAVARSSPGLDAVVARFGASMLDAAGDLDRARLAAIIFNDPAARADLEAIIHPYVRGAIDRWFEALERAGAPLGIADIPLVFETGRTGEFKVVVVTWCPPGLQVERIRARDGSTEEDARRRIATQWPIDEKARRADYVIKTDGTFRETDARVEIVLRELTARERETGSG